MIDYYFVTSLSAKSSRQSPSEPFIASAWHRSRARRSPSEPFIASGWQCTRPSMDSKTRVTGCLRFLRCWTGGRASFQRLQARGRAGFRLGPLLTQSRVRCRLTTSELNIAPGEALQMVDRTGRLRAPSLGLLLLSIQ